MNRLQQFSLLILIVFSLHLGMLGLFEFNLIKYIFKTNTILPRILHLLVFFCGLVCITLYQNKNRY